MAKYIIQGNVQVQQVLDPNDRTNLLSSAVHRAIATNSQPAISSRYPVASIPEYINGMYQSNFAKQANDFYDYGYYHFSDGLPQNIPLTGITRTPPDAIVDGADVAAVKAAIESEVGESISINFYTYGLVQLEIMANQFLINDSNYIAHARHDFQVFSRYRVFEFTKLSDGKRYRKINPGTFAGSIITFDYQRLVLDYAAGGEEGSDYDAYILDTTHTPETLTIDLSLTTTIVRGDVLHQVDYQLQSTLERNVWLYDQADNTYPDVHFDYAVIEDPNSYPYAMLFEDGKNVYKDEVSVPYRVQTEELLQKLGIKLSDVIDGMEDPNDPGNLDDVTDSFLLFGALIDSPVQETQAYLYEFFRRAFYTGSPYTQQDMIDDSFIPTGTNGRNFYGSRVKFNVRWNFIRIEVKNGLIGDPQTIPDVNVVPTAGAEIDPNHDGEVTQVNGVAVGELTTQIYIGDHDVYDEFGNGYNNHMIVYRKQLTDTTFVELAVHGLEHYTRLERVVDGVPRSDYIIITLDTMDRGEFYLPLAKDIMPIFNSAIQHYIFIDSLLFVVHVVSATKLPWYAQGEFLTFLRIIFAVVTWGGSEGVFEFIYQVLYQLLINRLITEVLVILVDIIGGDVAVILAAIAAIYAFTLGDGEEAFKLLSAEELMKAATFLVDAAKLVAEDDSLQIQKDYEEFQDLQETRQEQLDKLNALLGPPTADLELYEIVTRQPVVDLYESPTDFFNRSVHVSNPGVLSLDTIDVFVGNLLVLPQFDRNKLT